MEEPIAGRRRRVIVAVAKDPNDFDVVRTHSHESLYSATVVMHAAETAREPEMLGSDGFLQSYSEASAIADMLYSRLDNRLVKIEAVLEPLEYKFTFSFTPKIGISDVDDSANVKASIPFPFPREILLEDPIELRTWVLHTSEAVAAELGRIVFLKEI